ncbi:Alkali-sensitive linkage protein [Pleurotus pulmonarius]
MLLCLRCFVPVQAQQPLGKAGLAQWPNGNSVDIRQYRRTGKVSWYYSWSSYPVNTDLEFFVQMDDHLFSTVLGMNEPQQTGQSNISPEDGAQLWKAYLQPLKDRGIRLGSPAPSSAPSGKTWLQAFLGVCGPDCTVDFIALHWYGTNATQFINYVVDFHDTFQRPIWVTEWACHAILENYPRLQSFMDDVDFVERYAWFGAMKEIQDVNKANSLMTDEGRINELGAQYIGSDGAEITASSGERSTWTNTLSTTIVIITIFGLLS